MSRLCTSGSLQTERQTDRQRQRKRPRETARQRDRETYRETYRETAASLAFSLPVLAPWASRRKQCAEEREGGGGVRGMSGWGAGGREDTRSESSRVLAAPSSSLSSPLPPSDPLSCLSGRATKPCHRGAAALSLHARQAMIERVAD
eukprot:1232856-Rhodomonas_salina.4